MRNTHRVALGAVALMLAAASVHAQVAGSVLVSRAVLEVREIADGVSVRNQILGQVVLNENGETVGRVKDVIVTPNAFISYAILGAGGFLGMRRHDVAIPVGQFRISGDSLLLPGATREALKAMPSFEYAR